MFIDIAGLFYYIKCIKSIHTVETCTDICEKVCCKLACISTFGYMGNAHSFLFS